MTDYGKPVDGFKQLGTSMEPVGGDLGTTTTSVDRFFVCTVSDAPIVSTDDWRLTICGDAVADPIELTWADVCALPMVEHTVWLECAGNGRTLFESVGGYEVPATAENTEWTLNGMGIAQWRGPRLADVLALAEIDPGAAFVSPMGLDVDNPEGDPIRMCMPVDRALDPSTIVAIEMNGEPLGQAHGAPARLIVPGWVGAYSIKWLGELTVSSTWVPSWRADEYYVTRDPDGTITGRVTTHPVRSSLALPFPASLTTGGHELVGYARSGAGEITQVEWSIDGGPWQAAALDEPDGPFAWTVFRISVTMEAGEHVVRTRATDASGVAQPDGQPFHPDGVLWHSVIPHPIEITSR